RVTTGRGRPCRYLVSNRPGGDRAGARLRAADGQFAGCGFRPRFCPGDVVRGGDRRGASVALCRGDRDLDLAAGRPGAAVGQVHHRLLDHAAEAQSGCGRTGTRQDRAGDRRAHRALDRDEGPAARLSKGHAGRQGGREGVALHEVPLKAMREVEPKITAEVFNVLSVEASVKSRTSFGGTAPKNVLAQAKGWLKRLEKEQKFD